MNLTVTHTTSNNFRSRRWKLIYKIKQIMLLYEVSSVLDLIMEISAQSKLTIDNYHYQLWKWIKKVSLMHWY